MFGLDGNVGYGRRGEGDCDCDEASSVVDETAKHYSPAGSLMFMVSLLFWE